MAFGLGPVVRYELITTARRGRFYLARVVYGLALLLLLFAQFREFSSKHPAGATAEEVRTFAESTFILFAGAQGAALLCLIPALIAGVIADEHQRKTLHYLLASRLSSAEIVLGKFGARMVHVGTFVALGVPVVCLVALYGGLNPQNVFYVYLGTLAMVIFASGLSLVVSILAQRPRDAILVGYALTAIWLVVPLWVAGYQKHLYGSSLEWVEPVNNCVLYTNPANLWENATRQTYMWTRTGLTPVWFVQEFEWVFYWTVGLQTGLGLLLIVLAIVGLRPLRGNSWPGGQPHTGWWTRLRTRLSSAFRSRNTAHVTENRLLLTPTNRAPCGDDPMLWKERHTALSGGLRFLGSRPVTIFFSVLLACYVFDVTYPVIADALRGDFRGMHRAEAKDAFRTAATALAVLGILGVAASAAVSVTSEREQDTLLSLATTLLTPNEVIRAKELGAIWTGRRVAIAMLVLWGFGLILGAFHPLGVLSSALYLILTAWLVAALGVCASAIAKNSTRGLVATFVLLLLISWLTGWPAIFWQLQFGYTDIPGSWTASLFDPSRLMAAFSLAFYESLMFGFQASIAIVLTLVATRKLEATWGQ